MNAIDLLEQHHREIDQLFDAFWDVGDGAYETKRELGTKILAEIDLHAQLEEAIFYPAVGDPSVAEKGTYQIVVKAVEEHGLCKTLVREIQALSPTNERYEAKLQILRANVARHVAEEEIEIFPRARKSLGNDYLDELGTRLENRRNEITNNGQSITGTIVEIVHRAVDSLTNRPLRDAPEQPRPVAAAKRRRIEPPRRLTPAGTAPRRGQRASVGNS